MVSSTSPLIHNPLDTIRSKLPHALKHGTVEEITRLLEFPGALEVGLDFYVPRSTRYPATGFPPLLLAASFKRPEVVTLLLDLGANINQKAPCECTVLHLAALFGRLRNLEIFLARGALSLVNAPMTTGQFPLTEAAWKGHVKICRLLLDSGAMVDVQDNYCAPLWYAASADNEAVIQLLLEAKADANGMSHNFSSLHIAAESNCPKAIKILLEKGHADASLQDAEGNTALQRAAIMGSGDAVSQLLSHTPTFIEHQNYFGETALNLAVKKRRPRIATTLLKHNANINSTDKEQSTPLLNACLYGWGDVVNVLLGYEVIMNQKDTFGNTPLHLAAYNGYFGICSTILKRGADVDSANNMQETPILVAAYEGHKNVVQLLLQHNAAADTINIQKKTPLHIASENGHLSVVSLLLDHLNTTDFVDVYDTTPLHVACRKGHAQVAELLLNHGAKLESLCTSRRTPLWYASESGQVNVMAVLVARGADINIGDANGQTPLHKACLNKHTEAIEFLVDQGADFNKFNVSKKSALWEAWCSSDIDSVRPLIQTKSGLLRNDFQGNSALHYSCSQGNTKIVEKLLEDKRIDPSVRNDDDNSPLDLAVNKRHIQVIFCILASQHYYPSCSIAFQSYRTKRDHMTPLYWCLQSIVGEGSRSKDELSIVLYWAIANNRPYLIKNCLQCFPEDLPLMKGRMTCLHVAAQHGRHELIKKSLGQFDLNQTMDEGITPLQVAAANGDSETATALLGMTQMGSDKRLEAIVQLNNANECSLSLAMKGRHSMTKDLLWAEIKAFIGLRKDYHKDNPEDAERIIELCAQLEKPGGERLLLRILKEWFPPPITNTESWTVLHFAVYHGQAVAVWWLLSHGAHLKSDEIDLAHRILKPDEDCVSQIINDLLNNPPQIVEHTAITDNDFVPAFPKDPKNMEELLGLPVAIIDFYGSQKMMNFHYTRRKVHEVIYDPSRGPKRVMEEARRNNRRQLGFLKNELLSQTDSPAAERRLQVSNYMKKTSEDKSDTGDLQFRWIHLPANHVRDPKACSMMTS